jgi:hypothetical protein
VVWIQEEQSSQEQVTLPYLRMQAFGGSAARTVLSGTGNSSLPEDKASGGLDARTVPSGTGNPSLPEDTGFWWFGCKNSPLRDR